MNGLLILVIAIVAFVAAYILYGGWLAKKWGLDDSNVAPSVRLRDDVDYCPADKKVVFGHHFSSIAGAGPITGPIQAVIFGWLPVYLWIVFGSIFIGGIHDWGALFASMRHDGKTVGEVIRANVGEGAKNLFGIFSWLALILVVAAFTDICAGTFAYDAAAPEMLTGARAGTASILFIVLAIAFGYFVYRKKANVMVSTVIGVVALFACIWIGYAFPILKFSKFVWYIILLIYIGTASVAPVWILLQPRDYLCSFLLYAMLIGAFIGIVVLQPTITKEAFLGFKIVGANGATSYLFPILFITVACGAISGFHSLVGSGSTSKQIAKETDSKLIGYGAMLVEGVVAVIALIAVGYLGKDATGTPAQIFAAGVAEFMAQFGLPLEVGKVFVTLAFSAFALTSLDTATRLSRYQFQELIGKEGKNSFITKPIPATIISVALAALLLVYGYTKIWPIFGASNQLLGAMTLLGLTVWFYKTKKPVLVTLIPMVFMFCVTFCAIVLLIKDFFLAANYVLGVLAVALFVLAVILLITAIKSVKDSKKAL